MTIKLNNIFCTISLLLVLSIGSAQKKGVVTVTKDPLIDSIIYYKNIYNKKESLTYTIQIFSSNSKREINDQIKKFKKKYRNNFPVNIVFETPNYKARVGNFSSRLEADKNLIPIKKQFQSAFVFIN